MLIVYRPRLDSIIGHTDAWKEYISFACLRNHDVLYGKPIENQVYVHTKLLIADDRVAICGSGVFSVDVSCRSGHSFVDSSMP